MRVNIMKGKNAPAVDKSLEATRNIEYQLLNMKEYIENLTKASKSDIDITPAVSHTLEVLQHIDSQLQSMRSLLNDYNDLESYKAEDENITLEQKMEKPSSPPFPPASPPTFPPTYPKEEAVEQQPNYPPYPMYYPPPYPYYYGQQPIMPLAYEPYHQYPYPYQPQYHAPRYHAQYYSDPRVPPQDYPPLFHPYGYYSKEEEGEYPRYYESAKYPTVASSEPAYSSASKAVPKQSFRIAYYPWQQLLGKKSPMDSRVPYLNMYDIGKEFLVYLELPGVEKENLELRVDEQSIWINGKPTIMGSDEGTPVVQEHGYHEFYRQINLPSKIITNKTKCVFENGILIIKLQKNNPKKQPQRIKIP